MTRPVPLVHDPKLLPRIAAVLEELRLRTTTTNGANANATNAAAVPVLSVDAIVEELRRKHPDYQRKPLAAFRQHVDRVCESQKQLALRQLAQQQQQQQQQQPQSSSSSSTASADAVMSSAALTDPAPSSSSSTSTPMQPPATPAPATVAATNATATATSATATATPSLITPSPHKSVVELVEVEDRNSINSSMRALYKSNVRPAAAPPSDRTGGGDNGFLSTPAVAAPAASGTTDADDASSTLTRTTDDSSKKRKKGRRGADSSQQSPRKKRHQRDSAASPAAPNTPSARRAAALAAMGLGADAAGAPGAGGPSAGGGAGQWHPEIAAPSASYADLGGIEPILQDIRELIEYPLTHPEIYAHLGVSPPRGILLHGPPGCGKTLLAHAIAGELGVPFLKISAPEVVSGMSGESEAKIRTLFADALAYAPCIVFMDEIDAITPKRSEAQRQMEHRIVAQLLTSMDMLSPDQQGDIMKPVLVIGATNRPDSLDPALRRAGRFDREISLTLPDEAARVRILQVMCRNMRLAHDIDWRVIAKKAVGYVGADLSALAREAAVIAVNRSFKAVLPTPTLRPANGSSAASSSTLFSSSSSSSSPRHALQAASMSPATRMNMPPLSLHSHAGASSELVGGGTASSASVAPTLPLLPPSALFSSTSVPLLPSVTANDAHSTSSSPSPDTTVASATGAIEDVEMSSSTSSTLLPSSSSSSSAAPPTWIAGALLGTSSTSPALQQHQSPYAQHPSPSMTARLSSSPVPLTSATTSPLLAPSLSAHQRLSELRHRTHASDKLRAHARPLTAEQLAPLCIAMQDFVQALSKVQPSSKREGFATIPDVSWRDIGALESLRDELSMTILQPIRNPAQFEALGLSVPAGVLLFGPPGCGKTLVAKAIAHESGASFLSIKGPELLNQYVGQSELAVRKVFQRARSSAPCVIFFDELDALCPRRSSAGTSGDGNNVSERVVNQLLTEMDGLDDRRHVFVIAATNRPDIIDPAMLRPGRLDKLLYVPLPTVSERVAILQKHVRRVPLAPDVSVEVIGRDPRCEGFSGADCAALVREAAVSALREAQRSAQQQQQQQQNVFDVTLRLFVYARHFGMAFQKVFPSVSESSRRRYDRLQRTLCRARATLIDDGEGGREEETSESSSGSGGNGGCGDSDAAEAATASTASR